MSRNLARRAVWTLLLLLAAPAAQAVQSPTVGSGGHLTPPACCPTVAQPLALGTSTALSYSVTANASADGTAGAAPRADATADPGTRTTLVHAVTAESGPDSLDAGILLDSHTGVDPSATASAGASANASASAGTVVTATASFRTASDAKVTLHILYTVHSDADVNITVTVKDRTLVSLPLMHSGDQTVDQTLTVQVPANRDVKVEVVLQKGAVFTGGTAQAQQVDSDQAFEYAAGQLGI
ncbi:MAG: hypothetical protein ABR562_08165 [Thermoplasmatota archaeon]